MRVESGSVKWLLAQAVNPTSLPRPHFCILIFHARKIEQGKYGANPPGMLPVERAPSGTPLSGRGCFPHTGNLRTQTHRREHDPWLWADCLAAVQHHHVDTGVQWILSEQTNFPFKNFYFLKSLIQNKRRNRWNKHLVKIYFKPGIFNSHKNPPKKTHFPHLVNKNLSLREKHWTESVSQPPVPMVFSFHFSFSSFSSSSSPCPHFLVLIFIYAFYAQILKGQLFLQTLQKVSFLSCSIPSFQLSWGNCFKLL